MKQRQREERKTLGQLISELPAQASCAECGSVHVSVRLDDDLADRLRLRAHAARPDAEVFAAAVAGGYAVLTENVKDFTRLAADTVLAGQHHGGLLIALSSRFSRRPAAIPALVGAV